MNERAFSGADWLYAISMGLVPDTHIQLVQGTNPDIDTGSVPEDLTPHGGLYVWPSTAVACHVVSSSANDTAAGTGARTVRVQGLSLALVEIQEFVTLNGLTPVPLVNQYYRVNGFQVMTAGSVGTNAGEIDLVATVSTDHLAHIPAGYGRNQVCVFTVPANHTGWIVDGFFSQFEAGGTQSYCAYQVFSRNAGAAWSSRAFVTTSAGAPTVALQPRAIGPIGPGGDMVVRASFVGVNNTQATATMSLLLTPN